MEERQVTAAGQTLPLEPPFFVLATQNPIELEGTYPLPEAQLDRFLLNIYMDYLPEADEVAHGHRHNRSSGGNGHRRCFLKRGCWSFSHGCVKVPVAEKSGEAYAVRACPAPRALASEAPGVLPQTW